ncbi:hypothetical protein F7725_023682 [Dissostichus mawsoni]|uniref:Rubisco LSMT substrate-binding domain-containing protein n=1 Tax=Dissostichus mawsoni TaxID=36200 RepID=A0A7J5XXY3_DISMA|nr:hypothetical protein F7725_023682 [Dissostichus mawsoni]
MTGRTVSPVLDVPYAELAQPPFSCSPFLARSTNCSIRPVSSSSVMSSLRKRCCRAALHFDASVVDEDVHSSVRLLEEGGGADDAFLIVDVQLMKLSRQSVSGQRFHRLISTTAAETQERSLLFHFTLMETHLLAYSCPGWIMMPGHRSGRAARKRRKKQESITQSVSLSHQQQYTQAEDFKLLRPSSWRPRISPLLALCVFLVCERHRGEASDWFPYIDVLPKTYTCPAYFSDDVMAVLPTSVQRKALDQREEVRGIHSSHLSLFRWAWCSVNTRSVFMSHPSSDFLFGQDVYALAPFLDLLNHRPDVQVKASFNEVSRCYEIRSVSGTLRYEQALINYDSHDSQRLMMEYGFVASCNPNSVVYVDTDLLCDVFKADRSLDQKRKFLRENNFINNLTVSSEGPSWRLLTALRLMALPQTLYPQWKAVLLGQQVCEEREERSVRTVKTLCERILRDTHTALEKAMECSAEQPPPDKLLSRQSDDDDEDAVS